MPESVQSCFELSIHLSVSEPAVNCSKNSSREKKYREMYGKFPIHEFFRSDVLWKLFDIGFPYKRCYFAACLPSRQNGVENRDKAYCSRLPSHRWFQKLGE